jgi:hypothetical protein
MQSTSRFEKVDINKLIPYVNNARTHSKEQVLQLRSSLREFGFVSPVIVDKDYNIIAGHGRILAAKAEGMTEVPCVFVEHLTEAQQKAYIIADNRLALNAGWDEELLALEFADLKEMGFDLGLTGFDMKEIEKMFASDEEAEEDSFDVDAELDRPTFSALGDIWTLGRSDYQWCHEPCLYGWKKSGKHNWYGDRKQSTIWKCDKPSRSEKHPTMKPIPLLAPPIQNSTQTNGVVLDPFGGSGSTLICCEQLNRVCCTIELDPKFADVIVNRYIETVGSPDGVFVERDGGQIPYAEVAHE